MIVGEASITVQAAPHDVFEFVLDLHRYRQADHKIGRVGPISRDGDTGTVRFAGRIRGLPGPAGTYPFKVSGSRLEFGSPTAGPARWFLNFTGSFDCDITEGGTVVTHREEFRFKRPWRWVAEPLLRRGWKLTPPRRWHASSRCSKEMATRPLPAPRRNPDSHWRVADLEYPVPRASPWSRAGPGYSRPAHHNHHVESGSAGWLASYSYVARRSVDYDGGQMPAGVLRLTVELMRRVRSALQSAWLRDAGPPALITAVLLAVSGRVEPSEGDRLVDGLAYVLIAVCGASLTARRRRPVFAVAVIAIGLTVWLGRGYVGGPVFVTLWLALFALGATAPRRVVFVTAASALGLLVVVGEVADTSPGLLLHALLVGWSATAALLGDVVRSRRERVFALEERARQLEQTREEETRRRLVEERLSIARDLHDTVAHSMATINVQAGAAAHVIDRQPEQARDALLVIQRASGEVLDELAALLQLLRVDPVEESAKAPTPGLGELDELVASARRAGLDVTLRVDDAFGDVPRAVGVAAYRIVQESLTNVVRHAGSASATVTLRRDGAGVRSVEVVDEGDGHHARFTHAGTGVGIRGMRERAEATGGQLEAGPRPDRGFRVCATWPTP